MRIKLFFLAVISLFTFIKQSLYVLAESPDAEYFQGTLKMLRSIAEGEGVETSAVINGPCHGWHRDRWLSYTRENP